MRLPRVDSALGQEVGSYLARTLRRFIILMIDTYVEAAELTNAQAVEFEIAEKILHARARISNLSSHFSAALTLSPNKNL